MKRTILKTLCATFLLGLIMSSCLGENSSKIENNNALVYIKQTDYRNVAISGNLSFSHDYLNTLDDREFYHLDFAVHTKDGQNTDGSYVARTVSPVGSGEPLVEGQFLRGIDSQDGADIYPTQINLSLFSPVADILGDNWAFSYNCRVYEEDKDLTDKKDNIRLAAAILTEDQVTGTTEVNPLSKDKVVVRLFLERFDPEKPVNASKDKVTHAGEAKLNLQAVRDHFQRNIENIKENGSVGVIQFKYMLEKKEGEKPEFRVVGNLDEENPNFYMIIKN